MRFVRLAFAVSLFYNAYETHEWFFIVFGVFFLIQVIFNLGCEPNGCAIPSKKNNTNE